MMKNCFAKNLKALRVERGLSQKQLAKELDTTIKTLSHWETGYSEPSIDLILRIASFFDTTTDTLLSE